MSYIYIYVCIYFCFLCTIFIHLHFCYFHAIQIYISIYIYIEIGFRSTRNACPAALGFHHEDGSNKKDAGKDTWGCARKEGVHVFTCVQLEAWLDVFVNQRCRKGRISPLYAHLRFCSTSFHKSVPHMQPF